MKFTQTQLDIIRTFGRKELTEGCIIQDTNDASYVRYAFDDDNGNPITLQLEGVYKGQYDDIELEVLRDEDEWEILGHEPHLEDVFRVAYDWGYSVSVGPQNRQGIILSLFGNPEKKDEFIPYNPTIPLLEQDENTLKQLLEIIK